jgi:[ribosomal protein S5]-alanine N-acetyltransferase
MTDFSGVDGIVLNTQRLVLREFRASDYPAMQAYAGDAEVTRFTSWGPNTPEMTASVLHAWLEEKDKTPRVEWPIAIVRRSDGLLIGGTGVGQVDWQTGTAVFGYVLQRAVWGGGFATEAGSAIVAWAFGTLGLRSLIAHCEPSNRASLHVLNKLGFLQTGGLIQIAKENGDKLSFLSFVRVRPD